MTDKTRAEFEAWLQGQDFYELAYAYRHASPFDQAEVVRRFEALKHEIAGQAALATQSEAVEAADIETPFVHATIDQQSGLHELWLMVRRDGFLLPIAGPHRWPDGWPSIRATALAAKGK